MYVLLMFFVCIFPAFADTVASGTTCPFLPLKQVEDLDGWGAQYFWNWRLEGVKTESHDRDELISVMLLAWKRMTETFAKMSDIQLTFAVLSARDIPRITL